MKHLVSLLMAVVFWGFIAVKAWGTYFAAWSWWWLFIPIVPWVGQTLLSRGF